MLVAIVAAAALVGPGPDQRRTSRDRTLRRARNTYISVEQKFVRDGL
jgi:hypothetical protein